ncbi:MAG: NAD-dependent epimerase/dehydratase family protein [Ilumatobacteraceae bacterium]
MAPRLLVLGAGGFLGRSIVHHLAGTTDAELVLHSRGVDDRAGLDAGHESHELDLLSSSPGSLADLVDRVAPYAVVNCTGLAFGEPADLKVANVYVVMRLIAELEECKGVHLVHLGSAAEYGRSTHNRPVSETTPAIPQSDYGITKLMATEQLMRAAAEERISVTVLRVFNPIGRFSPQTTLPGSAARKMDEALRSDARTINLGPLDSWRDYIDTRDIARAVLAATVSTPRTSSVLNVARGEAVEGTQLIKTLATIAGFEGDVIQDAPRSVRSASVDWLCADVRAIKNEFGWTAEHTIDDSLGELWDEISTSRKPRE